MTKSTRGGLGPARFAAASSRGRGKSLVELQHTVVLV